MERVTDVLNNIYNTGMGHLENRRKQRQFEMQGQQFNLDQQLKQAQLGGAMQDQKLKQFRLDAINKQFASPSYGQPTQPSGEFSQSPQQARMFDPMSGKFVDNPDYLNPLEQEKLAKLQREKQKVQEAENYKHELAKDNANKMLGAIQTAKQGKQFFGPMGDLPSIVAPSTLNPFDGVSYGDRKNWESNVNMLLSQKVLDVMSELKKSSPTGSTGFGQLSNKELQVLREASTQLNKGLSPEKAHEYLAEMEKIYQKALGGGSPTNNNIPDWVPQGMEDGYLKAKADNVPDQELMAYFKEKATR